MTFHELRSGGDQAHALRGLMQRLQSERSESVSTVDHRSCAIGVTSGKGGVGKTNIALNLAIALAQLEARTCLIDGNLGLGNIDLLCGLNGYWNLTHVISGARNVNEIVLAGPEGVDVLPGASGLAALTSCPASVQADVIHQLAEFEKERDFVVIDTGAGTHPGVCDFLEACDIVLVVTTTEPTSVADAYALIKNLSGRNIPRLEIVINQTDSASQAHLVSQRIQETAKTFLQFEIAPGGYIPKDPQVAAAVVRRRPFLLDSPHCPASAAIQQLAARLKRVYETHPLQTAEGGSAFFPRVQTRQMQRAA